MTIVAHHKLKLAAVTTQAALLGWKMLYAASECSRFWTQWEKAAFHNRRSKYTSIDHDGGSGYNVPSLANNLPMKLSRSEWTG